MTAKSTTDNNETVESPTISTYDKFMGFALVCIIDTLLLMNLSFIAETLYKSMTALWSTDLPIYMAIGATTITSMAFLAVIVCSLGAVWSTVKAVMSKDTQDKEAIESATDTYWSCAVMNGAALVASVLVQWLVL